MDKASLRQTIRAARDGLKPLVRAQEEELVNAQVVSDEVWADARRVMVYKAVGSELSVVSATNAAFRAGKEVAFPRVSSGVLTAHIVSDWGQLTNGAFGIPEPAANAPLVSPSTIDIVMVPGVAFTKAGQRLGQGGGYYDRFLPTIGGISWGIGFDCQVVDEVPTEPHDRPVDEVIWPGRVQ